MPNDPDWLNEVRSVKPLPKTHILKKASINKAVNAKAEHKHSKLNWRSDLKNRRFNAVIDLHGMTLDNAFDYLSDIIPEYYHARKRVLLVITGKGSADKPSILKQELPRWLEHGNMANVILEHRVASPKDGGSGARYIILKNSN